MASAKGIPDRSRYGDPQALKPGDLLDWIIQEHRAERAGRHLDVRFGDQERGLLSWATKRELPKPGGMIALFQQPLHEHSYKSFQGEIPKGEYGAGKVKTHDEGTALITAVTPEGIHFTLGHTQTPKRYVLVAPKDDTKRWLLINTTPTKPIPYAKKHYQSVSLEAANALIDSMEPGTSVQAKIDGAASLIKLLDTGKPEVASYRVSKRTGGPIIHTERVFHGRPEADFPSNLKGTILRGELYGVKRGQPIPPQELGGILNSTVGKSIEDQRSRGIQLKNLVFDIQQLGQKKVTGETPYAERQQMIQSVLKYLPKGQFTTPPEVSTRAAAKKLLDQIVAGKHPLTHEGIVIHPPQGVPLKYKQTEDHDVYITGVFPGEGKWQGTGGGGFTYALKPGGPTVGKVGTGFDDSLRRDIAANPEDYIGRVAKIRAQDQHPSGAYRAPALLSLHEDYPMKKHAYDDAYKLASKLSSKTRNALPDSAFAEPEKRKYPIEDRSHAEDALSRVSGNGSPAEKAEIRSKVHARYPGVGKTAYDEGVKAANAALGVAKPTVMNPAINSGPAMTGAATQVSQGAKPMPPMAPMGAVGATAATPPMNVGAAPAPSQAAMPTAPKIAEDAVNTPPNPADGHQPAHDNRALTDAILGGLLGTAVGASGGLAITRSQSIPDTLRRVAAGGLLGGAVGTGAGALANRLGGEPSQQPSNTNEKAAGLAGAALGAAAGGLLLHHLGGALGGSLGKSYLGAHLPGPWLKDVSTGLKAQGKLVSPEKLREAAGFGFGSTGGKMLGAGIGAGLGAIAGHQATSHDDKEAAFKPTTGMRLQMQQAAMADPRYAQGAQAAQSKFLGAGSSGTRMIQGPTGPSGMELQRGPVNHTAPMLNQRMIQGPGGFSGMQTNPGPVNNASPMLGQRVMQGPMDTSGLELDREPKPQRYGVG